MNKFLINWLISGVITFITRQILKWGEDIDWDLVKKDFDERVRDLMPGQFMDDTASALAASLIEAVRMTIGKDGGIHMIQDLVKNANWEEIYIYVKNLILDHWRPVGKVQLLTLEHVKDYFPVRLN